MTFNSIWRLGLALGLVAALASGARAEAIDTRCIVNGGIAVCTEPVIVPSPPVTNFDHDMWKYNLCDMNGPSLPRDKAWCEAFGGTFGANGCTGGQPATGGNIVGIATRFEQIINKACSMTMASGGWGETMPYNLLCWSGGSVVQNGITTRNLMKMSFSGYSPSTTGCNSPWTGVVIALSGRTLACPAGYVTRTKTNGDLECWKLVPECAKVGNPINLLDGCKLQREVDYRSRSPGGIEVERYYNSGGYFRSGPAPQQSSDVWRTTWDRRLLVPSGAGNVLAYAQRPDGLLHVFRADGTEMLNTAGGGSAILERLTDGAAVATGWRLTTADKDIELYDVSGRLQSLTRRTGWTYALAYDGSGRLKSVTDALGGVVSLTYDASDRLSGFVAPGNRTYRYGYDDIGRLTTVTYPDDTVRTYHYENAAFLHGLTGITDENGVRFATWTYDSVGRAITSQHAGGAEAVTLGYGVYSPTANEGTTGIVDAFGTERTYYYQVAGGLRRIKRITQPCPGCVGGSATYTFDVNGNLASSTDFAGNKTLYTFDLARNLEISRTEAAGTSLARTITTQWHPVHRLPTRITAPSGVGGVSEVTDFNYDPQGNLLQRTVTAGSIVRQWTTTYNARGQVLTTDGPRTDVADVTTYTYYDATDPCIFCRGNVRTVANALGHLTTYSDYDADGQPTRTTDPNGVVTTSSYDARGRLRTRTVNAGNPTAETTTFDYDGVGQRTRTTMPDGAFLRYQYDDAHRLTELSDSQGNVTQYTLDAMGNPIKEDVFDPADRTVKSRRRTYDALNRLFSEIGAAGQTSTYQYDGNGNMTGNTDPLGRSTTYGRDALNRLTTTTDPTAGVTRYGYDARDRLVSVRDPINLTTSYSYDGLGNPTQIASPDTGVSTYVPNAQGNVVASTDARGQLTSFTYDVLNRQVLATYVGATVALDYDNTVIGGPFARGRLTRVTDPSGTTVYTYDAFGRALSKSQTVSIDAASKSFSVSYQYAAGRATGITYPSGRNVSYGFDAQGRINGVAVAGQPVLSGVVYFPFGGLQAWTWANGQPYRRTFDADGRIVTVTLGPDTGTYSSESWTFGYDGLNRLTSAVLPQGESLGYTYDANGNRKLETRISAATNYGYAIGSNRLQSLSGATVKSFTYDATGNLTGNGTATFAYDGRGRLTQSGGYKYLINGLGQRVAKTGPGVVTGANYYVYDEQGHLIGEYDATGAARQELIYLGDTPIASVRSKASGGFDIFAIYSDHLNTPRVVTNQANQKVWEWKIDTFGSGAANESPSGLGVFSFNLRFPGQYSDAETGTHYNYFRDYDPVVGRYIESDPIGLAGGINTFSYANNSIDASDRYGLMGSRGRTLPTCGSGWNQSLVPDFPLGFSVQECCGRHDRCYDNCKERPSREECDGDFCKCASSKCETYARGQRLHCEQIARWYCSAVQTYGEAAFRNARKSCCPF